MGSFRARALATHPEVDEVVIGSRREGTIEAVLESDLDAVVISTSTAEHDAQIVRCAERGLPILCEKPVALTLRDTREAVDAAGRAGVALQVAFQRRFDPSFRRARELIADGSLGTVYSVRMLAHDHEPSPEHFIPTSGGIYRDLHIHDFDMARWLTGAGVDTVYAVGAVRRWERFARHGDVDTAAILLTMTDGTPVLVSGTRHNPRGFDFRTEIFGSEDSVTLGLDARTPIRSLDPGAPPPPRDPYAGFLDRFAAALHAETEAFVELLQGRRENPCPGSDALEALRVAVACDRSRAEGRAVRLAEVTDGA